MPLHVAHIRQLSQQLVCPQTDDPTELVRYMGAMQAQEVKSVRWAVGLRLKGATPAACRRNAAALKKAWDGGAIIRMHLQRGTWQLLTAADYSWLLPLLGPKAMTVTRGWLRASGWTIPAEEERKAVEIIVNTCREKGSASRAELTDAVTDRGFSTDRFRMDFLLRMAELRGLICSGSFHPSLATYAYAPGRIAAALKDKEDVFAPALCAESDGVPVFLSQDDRDEALRRLAQVYFQSHQPATLEDFVWWSGLTAGDCRKGILLLGDAIHAERVGERSFYIMNDCRTRGCKTDDALLLPAYDEYLIGYKSRGAILAPEYSHFAHDKKGIFHPVIAVDGQICGNWQPTAPDAAFSFFQPLPDHRQAASLTHLEKVRKAFMGYSINFP